MPLALAALGGLVFVLVRGEPTQGVPPEVRAPAEAASDTAEASSVTSAAASALPPPQQDLPANRLHERVNGAEPLLRSIGCRRLLLWRVEAPPADVEVLAFDAEAGARQALARDAGPDRSGAAPGDEGLVAGQYVYFRRGAITVRIIGDAVASDPPLVVLARRFDEALLRGTLRP